ncbi:hypothetical protein BJF91_17725 [Allorhizobium taibaishanense]|uniref:Uncharacterized protein n=1 Tax=Allorhizobium taibaishanense TaxID=887144 RepID=A0A1Q9A328_9HYPH|nr:hypothetical protein [Allorhizobium taibaishanense]OLP48959.1 hypothetical protein BJF91_17725 [Allorhizobium taibaishanense]
MAGITGIFRIPAVTRITRRGRNFASRCFLALTIKGLPALSLKSGGSDPIPALQARLAMRQAGRKGMVRQAQATVVLDIL